MHHLAPETQSSGLRALFQSAAVKAFPKNALIFTEGNRTADSVYMVESGRVKLFLSNSDGKEIDIGMLEAGEIFGDTELDCGPRSVSAMTIEASRLVVIRQADFKQFVEEDPQFAMELMLKLIARNRELLKTVKSLALLDVSDRVALLLLEMATEEDGKLIINEKVSKRNIANRVGATREMASRVFRNLVASGYIQMENKKITLSKQMAGLVASATIVGLAVALVPSGSSDVPELAAASINSLPATGAGLPSAGAPVPASKAEAAVATGRVLQVYVKSAEGVLIEFGRAPDHLKQSAERWVAVQFPEPVGSNDTALALLGDIREEIGAGDIVDVRLATAQDRRAAMQNEAARVTALVGRKESAPAIDFERRSFARSAPPAAKR